MERSERKEILGQCGVRGENPRERSQRLGLEADLEGSPLRGRPLPVRLRNFRPGPDSYIAALGGPRPYMTRLREIDERTAGHERELERAWRALASECAGNGPTFGRRWRRTAERWDFGVVNELIETHNRWYPAEARLPMDPRRRDFALVNGQPYRRQSLDPAWVLERFPAELP